MTSEPAGGRIEIAGKSVSRLGLSTMRLTGRGAWGEPEDKASALELLRTAVDTHGITHIDTADAYGPHTVEELIREALYPYPGGLLIATKVGMVRPSRDHQAPLGRPEYLRHAVEGSLRRLKVDRLDLCYLHWIDPEVALWDQFGVLMALKDEGKIGHVGLANATPEDVRLACGYVDIAVVQNQLNMLDRHDPALELCRDAGIAYVASRPLHSGQLAENASVALAWVLSLGKHVAIVPGTSSLGHLRELVSATSDAEDRCVDHDVPPRPDPPSAP
jgi:aryl-alcohol dehydrogenase-like predicted oxidoreductase